MKKEFGCFSMLFFCCNFIFLYYYHICSGRPQGLWTRDSVRTEPSSKMDKFI